jgi:release factor H-coupled RctB family protein
MLVHSGSRSLGESVLGKFMEEHKGTGEVVAKGTVETSEEFQNYLRGHDLALNFARRNRFLIAHRILEQIDSRKLTKD